MVIGTSMKAKTLSILDSKLEKAELPEDEETKKDVYNKKVKEALKEKKDKQRAKYGGQAPQQE